MPIPSFSQREPHYQMKKKQSEPQLQRSEENSFTQTDFPSGDYLHSFLQKCQKTSI